MGDASELHGIKLGGWLDADQVADSALGPMMTLLLAVIGTCNRCGVRPVGILTTRSGEAWQGGPDALVWTLRNYEPTPDEIDRYEAFVAAKAVR